jgi:hypothetical protein
VFTAEGRGLVPPTYHPILDALQDAPV